MGLPHFVSFPLKNCFKNTAALEIEITLRWHFCKSLSLNTTRKMAGFKNTYIFICNKTCKWSSYFPVARRGAATSHGPCHGGGSFAECQLRSPRVGVCNYLPARCERSRVGAVGWATRHLRSWLSVAAGSLESENSRRAACGKGDIAPFVGTNAGKRSHGGRVASSVRVNGRPLARAQL